VKILLTGGTGFLGSSLIKKLVYLEHDIYCIKRKSSSMFRVEGFIDKVKWFNIETVRFDEVIMLNKIDCIIHCATDYGRKEVDPAQTTETNLILPLKLLHAASMGNVRIFINTDTVLDKRIDSYSLSKRQFFEWLDKYSNKIIAINVSLEHFYGPYDNDSKFVSYVINSMLSSGKNFINFTPGQQKRNFIYIDDVVDAFITILNSTNRMKKSLYDFEVGSDNTISIKNFVLLVKKLCDNHKTKLNFGAINYRENETMYTSTNTDKLKSLGWKPKYSLEEGLKKTIDFEINKH